MKFFCDHEELIEQLKRERDYLRAHIAALEKVVEDFREQLKDSRAVPKQVNQPQPITKEMIAKRMGIPESLVDQIDLERIGVQLPEGMARR